MRYKLSGVVLGLLIVMVVASGCTTSTTSDVNADTNSADETNTTATNDPAAQRDSQRRADIETVYQALRDWSSDNNNAKFPDVHYEALATTLDPDYIDEFPTDPSRPGNYYYVVTEDGYSFALGTWFESQPGERWTQVLDRTGDLEAMDALIDQAMGNPPTWQ